MNKWLLSPVQVVDALRHFQSRILELRCGGMGSRNKYIVGRSDMRSAVIEERLEKVMGLSLKSGAHSPDSTFCVMEAVAFVAGEKWSDAPVCACPVISAFLRSWNDSLPNDAERDRLLKPLIPLLVGTRKKS